MTPRKKHSWSDSTQIEVYNKDLESEVEALREKLEGALLREEYLQGRVKELSDRMFELSVHGRKGTYQRVVMQYFTSKEAAEKNMMDHVKEYLAYGDRAKFLTEELGIHCLGEGDKFGWQIREISFDKPVDANSTKVTFYSKTGKEKKSDFESY